MQNDEFGVRNEEQKQKAECLLIPNSEIVNAPKAHLSALADNLKSVKH